MLWSIVAKENHGEGGKICSRMSCWEWTIGHIDKNSIKGKNVMNAFMNLVDDYLVPPHGILYIYVIF